MRWGGGVSKANPPASRATGYRIGSSACASNNATPAFLALCVPTAVSGDRSTTLGSTLVLAATGWSPAGSDAPAFPPGSCTVAVMALRSTTTPGKDPMRTSLPPMAPTSTPPGPPPHTVVVAWMTAARPCSNIVAPTDSQSTTLAAPDASLAFSKLAASLLFSPPSPLLAPPRSLPPSSVDNADVDAVDGGSTGSAPAPSPSPSPSPAMAGSTAVFPGSLSAAKMRALAVAYASMDPCRSM
mmetsp:Transcript_5197/g.13048  ORF Transcript_5197/g.13048 Transcript_5197/m.13048 type:complete len:241 (-) Transcript_5197:1071-1793(-)